MGEHKAVPIGEHKGFDLAAVAGVFELKAKGRSPVSAPAATAIIEHPHVLLLLRVGGRSQRSGDALRRNSAMALAVGQCGIKPTTHHNVGEKSDNLPAPSAGLRMRPVVNGAHG